MIDSKLKGLAFCSLVALFASGQAFAHTGVRDQATAGVSSYNGFTVTHGCANGPTGQQYPVLGQAALFPYGSTAVWKDATGAQIDGTTVVGGGVYNLGLNGYAGFASAFATSRELVDDLGNVRALLWKDGAMEPKLNTITPFKVVHPAIIDNCVTAVKVRVGVINFCDVHANAANDGTKEYETPKDAFGRLIPQTYDVFDVASGGLQQNVVKGSPHYHELEGGNGDNNRADWWFYGLKTPSANFNDPDLLEEVTAAKYWTTLTVNNTAANIAQCAGTPHIVTVEPDGPDFDSILTGPNLYPFVEGTSNF